VLHFDTPTWNFDLLGCYCWVTILFALHVRHTVRDYFRFSVFRLNGYLVVSGFGFRVSGFGFRVSGFGFRVSGFGFRVSGFGFRVSGFGFRVLGFPCFSIPNAGFRFDTQQGDSS
jgi:hypothetical protein